MLSAVALDVAELLFLTFEFTVRAKYVASFRGSVAVVLGSWSGRKGRESFVQPCRSRMGLPKGVGTDFGIGRGWDRSSISIRVVLAARNSARRQLCIRHG